MRPGKGVEDKMRLEIRILTSASKSSKQWQPESFVSRVQRAVLALTCTNKVDSGYAFDAFADGLLVELQPNRK